jgi:hypothetical protein
MHTYVYQYEEYICRQGCLWCACYLVGVERVRAKIEHVAITTTLLCPCFRVESQYWVQVFHFVPGVNKGGNSTSSTERIAETTVLVYYIYPYSRIESSCARDQHDQSRLPMRQFGDYNYTD